jgi:hypothetical protein
VVSSSSTPRVTTPSHALGDGTSAVLTRAVMPVPLLGMVLAVDRPSPPWRLLRATAHTLPAPHVHWFRWAGEDLAGTGSLYRCRCGVVRAGF